MYSKRQWLNKDESPSTGSVVAYRGEMVFENGRHKTAFLEISDCSKKVRLHVSPMDKMDDFIIKMEKLRDFIDDFVVYLKTEENEDDRL